MRIHNWPMKALIIVTAAAALWLGLACQNPYPIIIAPSAPCGDYEPGQALVPSIEFRHFPGDFLHFPDEVDTQEWNRALEARGERLKSEKARVGAVLAEYRSLIHETDLLPIGYVRGSGMSILKTERRLLTDQYNIYISVDDNVELWEEKFVNEGIDPSTIVAEDSIPECMDGFPVIFEIFYGEVILQPL